MKRIIILIAVAMLTAMCGTVNKGNSNAPEKRPDVQYRDDFKSAGEAEKNKLLKDLKAEGSNYSVLIFTQNYKGQKIKVSNTNKRLFNEYVVSNLKTGIAGKLRIDNRYDTTLYDNYDKTSTVIEAKEAQKHKYIYVMKNPGNKNPFTITYSNTLRPLE